MPALEILCSSASELIADADDVVVLTGAGISAESGVPTFRGNEGLWKQFRPDELATPEAFARDPRLVWEWYGWRRELVSRCTPNAAHHALAAWGGEVSLSVVTQNVDGLHEAASRAAAGGGNSRPIELHGSIFRARCTACELRVEHRSLVDATSFETLPRCESCGSLLRPDVVWFGENLDQDVLEHALHLASNADVCIVIGTSGIVYPAAGLAALTHDGGGAVIEINPEVTPLTRIAAVSIRASATQAVPMVLEAARGPFRM